MQKYCQLKSYFSESYIDKLITAEVDAISSYLQNDPYPDYPYPDYPYEAFLKNMDFTWGRIPGLKPNAAQRYSDIKNTHESLNVDCDFTGNKPSQNQNNFRIYPVPAYDWLNIGLFPNQEVSVSIFNSFGQLVMNTFLFEKGKINISPLSSGYYILKAVAGGRVYSKSLLVYR